MRRHAVRALLASSVVAIVCGCAAAQSSPSAHDPRAVSSPIPVSRIISSSRVIEHGRVRCTAHLPTPLRAGRPTGLTFVLRNISHRTVGITTAGGSYGLVLRASDVTYDTAVPLEGVSGPVSISTPLRPGSSRTIPSAEVWVRWSGAVSVQPSCDGVPLPLLHAVITAPSPAPTQAKAIADVEAAAGGLFNRCTPTQPGVAVVGTIEPPSGDAPPMRARCTIDLHREGPFWVAQTLTLVPPTFGGVSVRQPYEQLVQPRVGNQTTEAMAWQFVVTKDGALPVASATEDATKAANKLAPDWDWTGHGWQGPGGSRCGGDGGTGGASPDLYLAFISVCPS